MKFQVFLFLEIFLGYMLVFCSLCISQGPSLASLISSLSLESFLSLPLFLNNLFRIVLDLQKNYKEYREFPYTPQFLFLTTSYIRMVDIFVTINEPILIHYY